MFRKFLLIMLVFACACPAFSADRKVPEYDLSRMKQMNPDFTTYPEADGIIWRKYSVFDQATGGGLEAVRQYVILGRKNLGGKWTNWNIPIPANGNADILEASAYDFDSLAKISAPSTVKDLSAGLITVNFSELPDTFILVVCWREHVPEQLSVEGMTYFQEDLRVWEASLEVHSPQSLTYKTFPGRVSPEIKRLPNETLYTWRTMNVDPFRSAGELARLQRSGVIFSTRHGTSGVLALMKDAEASGRVPVIPEAAAGFKRTKAEGITRLIAWVNDRPSIELAEGLPRKIPANGALTPAEKTILANSWLSVQKINTSLSWQLPFEPEDMTPLCAEMLCSPVLEIMDGDNSEFYDMSDTNSLEGAKIFSIGGAGRVLSRRIPSSKPADNRLSAIMNLQLSEDGLLDGTVRVILRGRWGDLILSDTTPQAALLSLFPALTNYKDVKYSNNKGISEISFTVEDKLGVATPHFDGKTGGILAVLPFFEPVAMRRLGLHEAPVEVLFPFIADQNITLNFPKNASRSLLSGKVAKNPDKINYSESYTNRRHRLIAESRFEVNMQTVTSGNMSLLRRYLDNWRAFSARQIPVR